MKRFLAVFEKVGQNFSVYSPDLPGCIATGATRGQATHNMLEALRMHVRGLVKDGLPVPESHSYAAFFAMPDEATDK
jgi:predicted RNase H-like HicB family nuclease